MRTGVALLTLREGAACGRVVHRATSSWTITSNEPVEAVLDCPLLSCELPGRLGTYFYPKDAVFAMRHLRCTRRSHWTSTLDAEENMPSQRESTHTVVHVTAERLPETTVHSASEASDNDMEENDVQDEDAEDDGASTVMDDADEPDVDDEPSVFADN